MQQPLDPRQTQQQWTHTLDPALQQQTNIAQQQQQQRMQQQSAAAAAAASPYGSVLPMTPAAWQMQQQQQQQQQQRHNEMRAAIAAGNQAAAASTAAPPVAASAAAAAASASGDDDDDHSMTPSEAAENDRSAMLAAASNRSHRAAIGRASTRSSGAAADERSKLKRQQEREREAEMHDLMNDDEIETLSAAASATPSRSKNNNSSSSSKHGGGSSAAAAAASSSSASKSKSGVLLDDVDLTESDLKLLDEDTKSRTQHNKRMRLLIKEGQAKQDRFVRRHLAQLRPFLSDKVVARFEPGGDAAPDDAPPPVCKTFVKQPSYILNGQMREYQILGLNWMIQRHENCVGGVLGDEMGLGKTLQVISFLSYLKYERGIAGPHLVVVPLSVMSAWMTEFKRWSPGIRVVRYHGPLAERRRLQNDDASFGNFDVIVTSYEVVAGDEEFFRYKWIWQYVIVDEGHRIKNEKTLQAQALAAIQRYNVILLSGTPTQNNTHEIFSLLHFLLPRVFTTSEQFDRCFNLSTNSIDQEQLFRIHTLLKPIMLRRMKAQIEQKLPPKVETKIYVGLTDLQREWYKRLVSRDLSLLLKSGSGGASAAAAPASAASQGSEWRRLMSLMMQLRKLTNHPYLVALESEPPWEELRAKEAAEDAARIAAGLKPEVRPGGSIEKRAGDHLVNASGKMLVLDKLLSKLRQGGHRVLLFSLFTRVLDLMEDFLTLRGWAYLRLDGSTNRVRRGVDIRRFNDPNSKFFVYLISTRAGGLGSYNRKADAMTEINLTGADTVIHFDSDFNPQCDLQAQDRCHRIGQSQTNNKEQFLLRVCRAAACSLVLLRTVACPQAKPVNVYRFVTENTVEERLISRAEKKLYLDHMVNRLSHAGNVDGAAADLSEQEELVKLTRDEMLSMLTFGASRIFKAGTAAGQTIDDEDIDTILSRSRAKADDERAKKLANIVAKRAAIAAASAASDAQQPSPELLLAEDESSEIAQQRADLQALNQAGLLPSAPDMMELDGDDSQGAGGGEEEEKKSGASASAPRELPVVPSAAATVAAVMLKGAAPSAAAASGSSGAIQENAQLSASDFLFSAPSSHIHEFEGQDFSAKPTGKRRAQLDREAAAKLILPADSGKRERKQRLVTIEDGRGKSFTILASQANDAPIPVQKRGKNKAAAGARKSIKKEENDTAAAIRASLASSKAAAASSSSAAASAAASSAAAAAAALPNEPRVIGHNWTLDWKASTASSVADLSRAIDHLNKAEVAGADITELPLVKLVVRRSDRWNVSDEEKAAYDRSVREEMQRAVALRNAKRKSWAEGAPEDQWLREVPAGAIPSVPGKKGGKRNNATLGQRVGAEGEYIYNTKWIHEDWCMLCKLGGELLCCGYVSHPHRAQPNPRAWDDK